MMEMEKVQVLGERVLLKLIPKESMKGGIILPTDDEIYDMAKVINIGDKVEKIKEGDIVYFIKNPAYPAFKIRKEGNKKDIYLVLFEKEVMAKEKED